MKYMLPADLRYGQKALIAYTGLDGYERAYVVELHWLKEIAQRKKKKLSFKKEFPFIGFKYISYTIVTLNSGTSIYPEWIHLYACESPQLMAKKFGLEYPNVDVDRVNDDLGC